LRIITLLLIFYTFQNFLFSFVLVNSSNENKSYDVLYGIITQYKCSDKILAKIKILTKIEGRGFLALVLASRNYTLFQL
jgi:hypothetical protein